MANKKHFILIAFIIVKFLLQYSLISPEYDLQRDEFLHLEQSQHLAWGYLSVPPITSWISVIIHMFGNTTFWVKFFPALFGAATIYIVWKAIEILGGNIFSLLLGATCILFSSLLRLNILYQPNSLDVLMWSCVYLLSILYIKNNKNKWLYIAAIFFAIGFLNKYNIVFQIIGLIPALLLAGPRKLFHNKHLYFALAIGITIISPNVIWQYNNNFPVINHLKELSETQLVHVDRLGFIKEQLLFFTGALLVILSAFYALLFYKPFVPYRFFILSFLFTITLFIYLKAKSYYAIGLYPIYISFGSVYLAHLLRNGYWKYLQPVAIAIPILLFIPLYKIGFPNKSPEYMAANPKAYKKYGLLRWEDGKEHDIPQDFADMLGWKELAIKVDSLTMLLPNPDQTLLLCDNYGQAGAINYYSKNKRIKAQSFDADYVNWLQYNKIIKDVILVKENDDEDKTRSTEIPLFDTVYLAAQRINTLAREDTISIYVLRGARVDINKRIKEEADKEKIINN